MPTANDSELLINYLDGELSQEERRSLEERLAQDPKLRQELKMFEQSWQSLDLLEREPTNGTLVETTLHSAVLQAEKSLNEQKGQRIRRNVFRFLVRTAVLAVLFVVSFAAGEHLVPQDRLLPRAVAPIIERLDMYLAILDEPVDFLPMLAHQRVFLPKDQHTAALSEYLLSKYTSFSDAFSLFPSYEEADRRIERIEHFDESYYRRFYNNYKKFAEFSREKKRELKTLHESIDRSPRREELFITLNQYYVWRKTLQDYEKMDLRQPLSAEKKIAIIADLKNRLDSHLSDGQPVTNVLENLQLYDIKKFSEALDDLPLPTKTQLLDAAPDKTLNHLIRLTTE